MAATEANAKDVSFLVNCGEDIDQRKSIVGHAPIHKAVLSYDIEKKEETLKELISCQANLDRLDANGWTALHHAAYNGDLRSAEILIEEGAKVNAFSNCGRTALHFAAMKNHRDVIYHLEEKRANLKAVDDQKCTPLHLACKKGARDAVTLLLGLGADCYAKDFRSWTPLHYAAYDGHPRICKMLLTWVADEDPALRDHRNS